MFVLREGMEVGVQQIMASVASKIAAAIFCPPTCRLRKTHPFTNSIIHHSPSTHPPFFIPGSPTLLSVQLPSLPPPRWAALYSSGLCCTQPQLYFSSAMASSVSFISSHVPWQQSTQLLIRCLLWYVRLISPSSLACFDQLFRPPLYFH